MKSAQEDYIPNKKNNSKNDIKQNPFCQNFILSTEGKNGKSKKRVSENTC